MKETFEIIRLAKGLISAVIFMGAAVTFAVAYYRRREARKRRCPKCYSSGLEKLGVKKEPIKVITYQCKECGHIYDSYR